MQRLAVWCYIGGAYANPAFSRTERSDARCLPRVPELHTLHVRTYFALPSACLQGWRQAVAHQQLLQPSRLLQIVPHLLLSPSPFNRLQWPCRGKRTLLIQQERWSGSGGRPAAVSVPLALALAHFERGLSPAKKPTHAQHASNPRLPTSCIPSPPSLSARGLRSADTN